MSNSYRSERDQTLAVYVFLSDLILETISLNRELLQCAESQEEIDELAWTVTYLFRRLQNLKDDTDRALRQIEQRRINNN